VSAFATTVQTFLAEYFALHPLHATEVGMHAHDARWPDLSAAGREARLASSRRWISVLTAIPAAELEPDERIDRDLVVETLEASIFSEERLDELAWDPLAWVYLLGDGIFPLLAREFAPLSERLASATARLEGIPTVVDAAVATLVGHEARPVSRLHTETALAQLAGVGELAKDAVATAEADTADPAVPALLPRLRGAADVALAAIDRFARHLEVDVLPRSQGEGRLGPELFAEKLRWTLADAELTPDRVLAAAERDVQAVRAEMARLSRDLWPTWCPGQPLPTAASEGSPEAADQRLVRGVLDAIAAVHQVPDDMLDFCRAELERIEAFCRERDVIELPGEPLDIRWTPVFLRAFGGAMLIPPGPLDQGQRSFFAITPIPEDWTADQAESWLREENDRQLRVLTIHEAVPGHYLQLAYSNRCPSLVRAIFQSGVFAEGWAVYVTQVMMDLGYGADDPALMLIHWKFYLRAAINAIIDGRIHAHGMTEEEAVSLMVEGGFQEEAEARNKYKRARLSSTQLSTYFLGSIQLWAVELEARRRLAAARGVDPASIQPPALPGGHGETPGFAYRAHLEGVLAHGTPPIPFLRRVLFGPV
jgi:uncharacterized protein (DUF885 family)